MPLYEIAGPDGKVYEIEGPAGATREQVISAIQSRLAAQPKPQEPKKAEDVGIIEGAKTALKRGFESFGDIAAGYGLAGESLFGTEAGTRARMEAIKREQEKEAQEGAKAPMMTVADFERIAAEKGVLEAAKEAPKYILEQLGLSGPQMAVPLAVGAGATAFGGPLIGAVAGIGAYGLQQFGNFLTRQAVEKQDAKELSILDAAIAAGGTAPIGYFADKFTVGLGSVGKNAGKEIVKELSARQVAMQTGKRAVGGATVGIIAEAPTEVLESAAERWQAGLSLTDKDAYDEYKESFFGAAAIGGGIGGTAAGYRGYKEATAAPTATTTSPVTPPVPPTTPVDAFQMTPVDRAREMASLLGGEQTPDVQARIEELRAADIQQVEQDLARIKGTEPKNLEEQIKTQAPTQMAIREAGIQETGFIPGGEFAGPVPEAQFPTVLTSDVLDRTGLSKRSSFYKELEGKDLTDPEDQVAVGQILNRVRANPNLSESTKSGIESVALQGFGAAAKQQDLFVTKGKKKGEPTPGALRTGAVEEEVAEEAIPVAEGRPITEQDFKDMGIAPSNKELRKELLGKDLTDPEQAATVKEALDAFGSDPNRSPKVAQKVEDFLNKMGFRGEQDVGVDRKTVPGADESGVPSAGVPGGELAPAGAAEPTVGEGVEDIVPDVGPSVTGETTEQRPLRQKTIDEANAAFGEYFKNTGSIDAAIDRMAGEIAFETKLNRVNKAAQKALSPELQQKLQDKVKQYRFKAKQGEKAAKRYLKYRTAPKGVKGNSREMVEKQVRKLMAGWANAPKTEVVQSITELPDYMQNEIRDAKVNPKGAFDPRTETVYLVADNLVGYNDITITVAHEAIGHYGLRSVLGNTYSKVLNDLYRTNDQVRAKADIKIKQKLDKDTAIEEVLAEAIEEKVPADTMMGKALQVLKNAIRRAMRAFGVSTLNDRDVQDLLNSFSDYVVEGKGARGEGVAGPQAGVFAGKRGVGSKAPDWVPQDIWNLHEKSIQAERIASGFEPSTMRPQDRTRNETMTFRRLNKAVKQYTNGNEQEARDLMSRMREETNKREQSVFRRGAAPTLTAEGQRAQQTVDRLKGISNEKPKVPERSTVEKVGAFFFDPSYRQDQIDRIRVRVAYKGASIERKLMDAFNGKIRDALGNIRPDLFMTAAEHSDTMTVAAMKQGTLYLNKNIGWDVKKGPNSLEGAMNTVRKLGEKLGSQDLAFKLANDAFIARRANALKNHPNKDVFNLPSQDKIDAGLQAFKDFPELDSAFREYTGFKNGLIDAMVDGGRLSPEQAKTWKDAIDYVPWNRIKEYEETAQTGPKGHFKGLTNLGQMGKLTGSENEINNVFDNMVGLSFWMTNSAIRNHAALNLVDTFSRLNLGIRRVQEGQSGVDDNRKIYIYRDGKPESYELDSIADVYAFKGVESVSMPMLKSLASFANFLRKATTATPQFAVSQLFQDSYRATVMSGTKNPFRTAAGVLAGFKDAYFGDPTTQRLEQLGIVGMYDLMPGRVKEDIEKEFGLKQRSTMERALNFMESFSIASDAALRKSVFERTLAETKSEQFPEGDMLLARYRAQEIINFKRQGASGMVGMFRQVIPFMNAYIQGMDVFYRSMTGRGIAADERAAATKLFWATGAKLATLSLVYAMMVGDDEEYEGLRDFEKDKNFIVPGAGIKIPVAPEVGFLFKVLPERAYNYIASQGTESPQDATALRKALFIAGVDAITGPNLTPQVIKPLIEVNLNQSFFTNTPIVGRGLEQREASQQFTANTSELAKMFGELTGLSPMKLEYVFRGYTGIAGGTLLDVTNMAFTNRPERHVYELPGFKTFMYDKIPGGYKEQYYDLRDKVTEVNATINGMIADGRTDELMPYLSDEKLSKYALVQTMNEIDQQMEDFRALRKLVAGDKSMGGEEKRKIIDDIDRTENELLKFYNIPAMRKNIAGL